MPVLDLYLFILYQCDVVMPVFIILIPLEKTFPEKAKQIRNHTQLSLKVSYKHTYHNLK